MMRFCVLLLVFVGCAPPAPQKPPSLFGTEVDGRFELDAQGRFRPSASAIRLFDYFMSGSGEVPAADLDALVRQQIKQQLPKTEEAAAEAFYLRYLERRRRYGAKARSGTLTLEAARQIDHELFGSMPSVLKASEDAVAQKRWRQRTADLQARLRYLRGLRRNGAPPASVEVFIRSAFSQEQAERLLAQTPLRSGLAL